MRVFPAWGWSLVGMALILLNLSLGIGGPSGRVLSRSFFWLVVSLDAVATLFSYLVQYRYPTAKLSLINAGTVLFVLYAALPLWHFGVQLPVDPGTRPVVHWWINAVALGIGVVFFFVLGVLTRPLKGPDKKLGNRSVA